MLVKVSGIATYGENRVMSACMNRTAIHIFTSPMVSNGSGIASVSRDAHWSVKFILSCIIVYNNFENFSFMDFLKVTLFFLSISNC